MNEEQENTDQQYWENRYQQGRTGWDRGEVHPALEAWLERDAISPPSSTCKILVPGCGHGYEVLRLAELGFDVTAVDFAESPVKHLRRELERKGLQANLVFGDFFEVQLDSDFDVVYEQTCLCAINPREREAYEQRVFQLLKPSGQLCVLFMQTGDPKQGPPFHCDIDDMKQLFSHSRWDWNSQELTRYDHPAGSIFELGTILLKRAISANETDR